MLFVAVDGRPGMGPLLGGPSLDDTDRILQRVKGAGQVRGRTIPADQAFGDYLDLKGVGGLLRRAASATSLPMIAAATPGLEHLLVLGKIKELERSRAADLIVVDAPPAGHAAPFLRSATGLSEVVESGPIREQAQEVGEMLRDPARCKAMLVTLPEVTPVTELLELAGELGGELGIALLPTVVNACWPDRAGPAEVDRRRSQGPGGEAVRPRQADARERRRRSGGPDSNANASSSIACAVRSTRRSCSCRGCRRPAFGRDELSTLADALAVGRRWRRRDASAGDRADRIEHDSLAAAVMDSQAHRHVRPGRGRQDDHGGRARPRRGAAPVDASWSSRSIRRGGSPMRSGSAEGAAGDAPHHVTGIDAPDGWRTVGA